MNSPKRTARIAGIVYSIVIITGTLYLQFIPSQIKLPGKASEFKPIIPAFESALKMGIVSEIICWVLFLVLPFLLYRLLKHVNELYAKLMVTFAVVQVPISFSNLSNKFAVLNLINNPNYLKIYSDDQRFAQVKFYLHLYHEGNFLNHIFWGLWLFPFGYLVYRSGFIPKVFGVLLMMGCLGYVIDFFGTFLFPSYDKTCIPDYIILPASLGEIGLCLWMMIIGIRNKKPV
ncbi:DUF4386 domain-containing protein [Chryseobacterium paridis]|uniref:DUF4386 domain-containing protein n=1 Tax=Chryseobacterium paridis TaxID=2800328 RepID=A0ABS1FT42_9FLAO|nr:DUF4386 domain-containing protein [Chryseobacterium paridis]MBK1895601.1 DUF4386 domain-containing protein [Chryseobacterium paridis]